MIKEWKTNYFTMNFQFDLKSKFEELKGNAPRYASLALTTLLVVAAVVHTLVERLVAYYRENSETINADVKAFADAVRTGFPIVVRTTREAGADARVLYEEYRPVVVEKSNKAYEFVIDNYNNISSRFVQLSA